MKNIILLFIPLLFAFQASAQQTIVKGVVKSATDGEALGFADVFFTNSYIGVTCEGDGSFEISTTDLSYTGISATYLGFDEKSFTIEPGVQQTIEIILEEESEKLKVVIVKAKRKVKKDPKAIALYKRVVKNKENNKPDKYDYYSYEDYTKTEFDLFNVKDRLTKRKILKPFDFIFENMDTTENGNVYLPVLLKEKISEIYYRKKPKKTKTIVKADQFSGIDNVSNFGMAEVAFPELDMYANTIELGGKGFVSPFSKGGQITYKYFLSDSMDIDGRYSYKLEFTPRRKGDLAFTGEAWIDKETAALRSLEVYVLDQINVNYLTGLEVKQEYQYLGDGNWFKKGERMMVLMNLTENKEKQAVRVVRTASFDDVKINEPYEDEVFKGDIEEIIAEAYKREEDYWTKERHTELSTTEENIYKSVKKVKETRAFKIYNYLGRTVSSGFLNAGPIEFGRFFQFYSFNAIEGNRYRMGFRTNPRQFRDKFLIEGYGAYGDKDKLFKYHLGAKFHLKRTNNKWHMIGGHYHYDWSDYNFRNPYMTHDHILGSLLRKKNQPLDNLFLMREGYVFYEKEWIKGFTNTFSAKHKSIYEWDGYFEIDDAINEDDNIQALEFTVNTQWGLGQLMVGRQGGFGREAIDISAPVLNVEYTIGVKNWLGSDYGYHRLNTRLSQKLTSKIGRTYYTLNASKIWGSVAYPLLTIHKGNGNFLFRDNVYNMMDDLEFVNDAYVSVDFRHHFDGFILNSIPLVKKAKMRIMVYGKGLYGGLSDANSVLLGPDAQVKDLNGFYAEAGIGLENVFKLFKVYGIFRLTQLDDPDVTRFGVKFDIAPSF